MNLLNIKFIKNSVKFVKNYSSINVQNVSKKLKSWKEIPGPTSLPILKQTYHFIPGIGSYSGMDIVTVAKHFHKSFGPIVRLDSLFGAKPKFFLFDLDAAEHVLRNEDSTPIRPGFDSWVYFKKKYKRVKEEQRPTGLSTDQGENWKSFRSSVNPIMLKPNTIKQYKNVLEEVATDMIQRMKCNRNKKNMIEEFDIEMNKWSLESIGTVALGGRIGCLNLDLEEDSKAKELIDCVHEMFLLAYKLDYRPSLWKYFTTKTFIKAMNVYQKQYDLCKYFIDRARKDLELSHSIKQYEEKSVLEKLLALDERVALIMASEMLLGGVDNAAMSIIAALYLLGTNRDKQQKLRAELKSSPDKRLYLKACLKEQQRMMPVASGNIRRTTQDYNLLGYFIPKGMDIVIYHKYLSLLDEQYPRAMEFIPERWLVDKNDPLYHGNAHAFTTLPFGYGSRMCIGKRIAELQIEIFLSKLIENFEVEWFGSPPKVETTIISCIQGPYNFVFKDAKL